MDTIDLSEDRRVIGVTYLHYQSKGTRWMFVPGLSTTSWWGHLSSGQGSEESACLLIGSFLPLWFWSSLPRTWQAAWWYCCTLGRMALSQDVSVRLLVRTTTPLLKEYNQPSIPARVGPLELSGPGLDQNQWTSWGLEGKWQRGRTVLSELLPQQYWNWPGVP